MEKLEVVSLIPVRGGSVRVPRKNIKMLAGKPMMNWTIEASLKSKYIDRTFVSTEDAEIKEIALKAGAEVIDRPAEFTVDNALPMTTHHLKYCLWKKNYHPDILIHLYATSPLRTAEHIDEAYELYRDSNENFLCSVCFMPYALRTARYIDNKTGLLEFYIDFFVFRDKPKTDLIFPKVYQTNGAIQIGPFRLSVSDCACGLNHVIPYIMSPEDSIDVDTPFDFKVAEMLLKERIAKEKNE